MLSLVLVMALGLPSFTVPPDTLIRVQRGDRLEIQNLRGSVSVVGWDRDEVELRHEEGRDGTELRRHAGAVTIRSRDPKGRRIARSYRISIPRWMEVRARGVSLSMDVEGVEAPVSVRTVEGDIRVRAVRGPVQLRSVDGRVEVDDVIGDVEAGSGDDHVWVRGVTGNVRVTNVDGDVMLRDVDGARVVASTVDGSVEFDGVLRSGGEYRLRTHDGDLTARIQAPAGASVTVSTHDGEFRADFPVTMERIESGRRYHFRIGAGEAELELEAFDGDITLLRR